MKKGKLYGVSTGPGEAELITVKALKTIEKTPVIAAPRTKGENCMALDILKQVFDISKKEIIYLDFSMKRDADILESTHNIQAAQIIEVLNRGLDVSMLNIGDASLFGTYCYIRDIVENEGYETEVIPGVTSFSAIAAKLGKSLTVMEAPLTIIPGDCENIEDYLSRPGTKVLMKSGRDLPAVKSAIEKAGLMENSSLVANCGLPTERVFEKLSDSDDNEGYFATILIGE